VSGRKKILRTEKSRCRSWKKTKEEKKKEGNHLPPPPFLFGEVKNSSSAVPVFQGCKYKTTKEKERKCDDL